MGILAHNEHTARTAGTLAGGELYVGLMSGTSLDGIDAILVAFENGRPRGIAHRNHGFNPALRRELMDLHRSGPDELRRAALASAELATAYAAVTQDLLASTGHAAEAIRAIGCHGQTVRHDPDRGYTLQLNQPARLAELTGIPVVADFRARDIAAGGQGAPLVPAFHAAVFGASYHRVVLNLGGIANLTDLPPGGLVRGFDTGPGNMLLDAWTQQCWQEPFDHSGRRAASGLVLPQLLQAMLAEPYFALAPPKSTGRDRFHLAWLCGHLHGDERPEDVLATLAELTANTVAAALREYCKGAKELLVCGGGAENQDLLARLSRILPDMAIESTASAGIPPMWVEAMAFAWLARQAVLGQPGNLPAVTGAAGPRVLGAIYPA
ncbi:MAG: anhydro-N-acetylmuramic acid kinase [Burkholderiales bacterium]|nr:MAG: anhydro-N-acetylmuramic acid kinase [Burkholderiales bacterium]